jgi:thiamine biosynthesis lipoprotein
MTMTARTGALGHVERPWPLSTVEPRLAEAQRSFAAMGGHVALRVACVPEGVDAAARLLRIVEGRLERWAGRLTRFDVDSDLSKLNRDASAGRSAVAPTLGAALEASLALHERSEGIVDVSMLDARLAAEDGDEPVERARRWWLEGSSRRWVVGRRGPVRFDLDGIGKGWIADRALGLLAGVPAAMVDADGDVALRVDPGVSWHVAVADPRHAGADLAILRIPPGAPRRQAGISTSGTSVHRWEHPGGWRHHLLDPATGRPARTDVVQATVVAENALVAEALAKSAVILGSEEGLELLDRAGALAEVLLLEDGDVIATPRSLEWLS